VNGGIEIETVHGELLSVKLILPAPPRRRC
jgi:hypothetical protein